MNVLGINVYHGDVSAALVSNGELLAAVEEERFRRIKHFAGFPREAIRTCLKMASMKASDIDHIAVSRDPSANRWRKVRFALSRRPGWNLVSDRFRNRAKLSRISEVLSECMSIPASALLERLHWVEHHPAHLASAFFVSPFDEAAVCAVDGFGDFVSTSSAIGRGGRLTDVRRTFFPHSLGLLYLAMTQFLGFRSFGDEYKVMGLAPYGSPDYVDALRQLVSLGSEGGFELDLDYFRHWSEGAAMTWENGAPTIADVYTPKLETLLGPARGSDEEVTERHQSIAASLQRVFEDAYFHVLRALGKRSDSKKLCLAGGCAMNSVANGKIREQTPFEELYIQPAAADNGTALGAAFFVWNEVLGGSRGFQMTHAYWGPAFGNEDVRQMLSARSDQIALRCKQQELEDEQELVELTAAHLDAGRVVGWFQGPMEWGARALGNRSILADPRRADMRSVLNEKIKLREAFRPFAPSILAEALDEYFVGALPDAFMQQVYPVRESKRAVIPAVTHVDGTGRVQAVRRDANPRFWKLLRAFEIRSGVPVLLNTSFNENEPIVQSPNEALDCFLRTDMDVLVVENHLLEKLPAPERRPGEEPGRSFPVETLAT